MKSLLSILFLCLSGCATQGPVSSLRLATTTSTYDSGLLDDIIPQFEDAYNTRVDIIAVGTGQALFIAESGDVDIILVHAPEKELEFVAQGHGTDRYPVMFNDFVIVGPHNDPAGIRGEKLANDAFTLISQSENVFISRGDNSGTHTKELLIWDRAGITPNTDTAWYRSLGQGMGETLIFTNETEEYTLTDRGTFLALGKSLPNLTILFGNDNLAENPDRDLLNYYHVIPVNPQKGGINHDLALKFVEWLTHIETQKLIADFGISDYGQPLFFPNSSAWHKQDQ